jgi:serine/threonine protein kinase
MNHRFASHRASIAQITTDTHGKTMPNRLGPWLLERPIGAGAMATIYQARPAESSEDGARYAVKLLNAEWQEHSLAVSLFRREAAIGRRVSHSHLITVLSTHVVEPPYYLVMPLLVGRTLEVHLSQGEIFSLPHALWIARQAAEALHALHGARYLHGDVKPGNLMLSPEGHATLLDLGFARELAETGSALDRPVVGTISYLAPELLTSTMRADERSDLYSLGATLFEMLAGRPPVVADSLEELAERQQRGDVPDLRAFAPQVPAAVAALVRSLVARDPFRRPRRALDVVRQLIGHEIGTLAERIPA